MGRRALEEVRDRSWEHSGRFEMGRVTLVEVWDESRAPRGGRRQVGGHSGSSGTG